MYMGSNEMLWIIWAVTESYAECTCTVTNKSFGTAEAKGNELFYKSC